MSENNPGNDPQKDKAGITLREEIERFYFPRQLINAITEFGTIPNTSEEALMGIGFLDIADYSFLSKFLSPNENQTVLNGLYSAFNWVLEKHDAYLNKLEGDSIMFQYGGPIDPNVRGLDEDETALYIARELFYTCIELQRVCSLFNQANDRFLYSEKDTYRREEILRAFNIIKELRNNEYLSSSINALFQIRIRVGASIGKVMVGNFGPIGAKRWDVIGMPVINAKRMESTAPIGGFRISEEYFKLLEKQGIVDIYHSRFTREAQAMFSLYKDITKDELFKFRRVLIKEKRNASFNTYSVQVEPGLPEEAVKQMCLHFQKDEEGAHRIVELIKYYRGNKYVLKRIEEQFHLLGVYIRKDELLNVILPQRYNSLLELYDHDMEKLRAEIDRQYSLKDLLDILGDLQDAVKHDDAGDWDGPVFFTEYSQFIETEKKELLKRYEQSRPAIAQTSYFYNYIFPLFFYHIKSSILEYQAQLGKTGTPEDLEGLKKMEGREELETPEDLEELNPLEELKDPEEAGEPEVLETLEELEELKPREGVELPAVPCMPEKGQESEEEH